MTDESNDQTYVPLYAFADQSPSYVHGFESGGIALQMERGETLIARSVVHAENRATLIQMAEFYGYDCSFGATSDETYLSFEASKVRPIRDPSKPNLKLVAS